MNGLALFLVVWLQQPCPEAAWKRNASVCVADRMTEITFRTNQAAAMEYSRYPTARIFRIDILPPAPHQIIPWKVTELKVGGAEEAVKLDPML